MKTHGPRFFGKPPRKLLAGQVDQSEATEGPKMLVPAAPVQASGHDIYHQASLGF